MGSEMCIRDRLRRTSASPILLTMQASNIIRPSMHVIKLNSKFGGLTHAPSSTGDDSDATDDGLNNIAKW